MSAQLDALRAFVASRATAAAPNGAAPNGGAAGAPSNVLVVGSGKGGSGTSVVASLVALAAASAGRRVLLVDADPHVGPLSYLLGARPARVLADLRAGAEPDAVVTPVSATLSLVAGGPSASGAAPLEPAEQRALLRRVTSLYPHHDLVVLDGGSRLDTVCACCEVGGGGGAVGTGGTGLPARLLVVTGTDPIGLAAGYALVKAAVARTAALPGGPVAAEVIVNRHDDDAAHVGHAQIAEACGAFLGRTVRLAGALPDDGCLERALRAGMPLQDAAAGSPAAVAAQAMVERLLADLGSAATQRGAAPQRRPNPYVPPSSSPSPRLSGAVR